MHATLGARNARTLLLALLAFAGAGCADPEPHDRVADDLARARAAALFLEGEQQDFHAAAEAMAPLVARQDAAFEDLIRAAAIAAARLENEAAHALLDRAQALEQQAPALQFQRGNLLLRELDAEGAVAAYRRVLAQDPDDAPTLLQLGQALENSGDFEAAAQAYRAVRAAGPSVSLAFYSTATYKLRGVLVRTSETDEQMQRAVALRQEFQALREQGVVNASAAQVERSGHGRVQPPAPRPASAAAGPPPSFVEEPAVGLRGVQAVRAADLDLDGQADLLLWGPGGLSALFLGESRRVLPISVEPVLHVALGDLDDSDPDSPQHHPAPELLVVTGGPAGPRSATLLGWSAEARVYQPLPVPLPGAEGVLSGAFVDADHDGDLDLLLAGDHGVRMLRNDGAVRRTERRLTAGGPDLFARVGPARAVIPEDLDSDQDVDLLVVGQDGSLQALSNLRAEQWQDATDAWGLDGGSPAPAPTRVQVLDLDGDGRPDVVGTGPDGCTWRRGREGGFEPTAVLLEGALRAGMLADVDLDGHPDLLAGSGAALVIQRGPIAPGTARAPVTLQAGANLRDLAVTDIDRDHRPDLVLVGAEGIRLLRQAPGPARGLTLRLAGRKDNTHGAGALVELRSGGTYQRLWWQGQDQVLAATGERGVDVLLITWPNGVVQHGLDLPAGSLAEFVQVKGLVGSCPFLYARNREGFSFITDVLGATPLGLPMGPGQRVPFDHDEWVRVTGQQLEPVDGRLELVFTEELREVTYLDQVTLHALDHPALTEVHPDERFAFPPFPPHHVHTLTGVRPPARVLASNGQDVTALLSEVDDAYAQPFEHLPAQYQGLTEPWHLDITLARTEQQRAELRAAPRIRLALTGWLLWMDASVNMAAARHEAYSFQPPTLWVPDGDGWRPSGAPIGFPAGKTKTMIVDVTDRVDRDDPRLRLTTTLALSWDAIRVVLDDDDAPFRETRLETLGAELWFRGFSRPVTVAPGGLVRFDYDQLDQPRWDQHPGLYTRYGEVAPLLGGVDDRYAILGSGDALRLAFDAARLPPLPEGWRRDYLVYLDGWAKDRDPNTLAATRVEPLPFHGMSAYPPPPGEAFPDTPAHRAWRERWNTRPGRALVQRPTPGAAAAQNAAGRLAEPALPPDASRTETARAGHRGPEAGLSDAVRFDDAQGWSAIFDAADRDAWQRPRLVLDRLGIGPDSVVAEIGGGTGYFPVRIARRARSGRVYSADVAPGMQAWVQRRALDEGLANLTAILCGEGDPGLPEAVDVLLLCDTYHHISKRVDYFRRARALLRPGGVVAVIDFRKGNGLGPPDDHKLGPEVVRREMAQAGYELATEHGFLPRQYFHVYRPAAPR